MAPPVRLDVSFVARSADRCTLRSLDPESRHFETGARCDNGKRDCRPSSGERYDVYFIIGPQLVEHRCDGTIHDHALRVGRAHFHTATASATSQAIHSFRDSIEAVQR